MKRAILAILAFSLAAPSFADKRLDDALAKANDQIQKGRTEDALKTMQKAASSANTAEAWLALARIQRRVGNRDEAAETTRKAVQVAAAPADRALALAALSNLALREGAGKDALTHATEAVAAQENAVSLAALARAQARTENIPAALQTIQRAMGAGAATADVHEAHGDVLLAAGRAADAAGAYRQAMTADPHLASARAGLAQALLAQGKAAEAVTEARAATEADNNSVEAHAALASATLAADAKLWNDAIAAAQQAVFLNPKSVLAQVTVARIFEQAGNLQQAAAAYQAALAADPGYLPAQLGLVQMQVRQGKYKEGLAEARKLVAVAPNSGQANLLLGTLLARSGEWAEAADALNKAVAGGVNTAEAYAYLGTAQQYNRRSAEAMAAYKKAVELEPGNISYRTTYGLLLGVSGQPEAGIAELQKVVQNPAYKDADAWINLGWLYRSTDPQKPAESVAAYQKALAIDPQNTTAMLGLGWAHYYSRNYDAAAETFIKVAAADETMAGGALNGAAWAYLFKKDVAKAEEFRAKSEAAGRKDERLVTNIDRMKKGLELQQRERERADEVQAAPVATTVESVTQTLLYHKDPAAKVRAAGDIRRFGPAAVDPLINALLDTNKSVKQAAARNLGLLGTAAKKADPHLRQLREALKCDEVIPTAACLKKEEDNANLIKTVEAALRAVNGR